MWFLGHLAIGYFIGKSISKITKENVNLPLILFCSLLPDIDVFIPELVHRSITHSVVLALMMFVPIFLIMKKGFPYFGAMASHTLIGDYFTGTPFQMFWPVTQDFFLSPYSLRIDGVLRIIIEGVLFAIMLFVIVQSRRKQQTQ
jgi:membrane-bound metal-dependent hydrolase YbcI (DUF457 family)